MASEESQKTGLAASGALHGLLLAFILVGFAAAPKFEDASETTPVDTITKDQFEQMMGERSPKPPTLAPRPAKPEPPQPPQPPPELRKAEETPTPPPQPPAPPQKVEAAKLPPPPAPPPRPEPPPKPDALETPQPPVKPKIVDLPPPERPRETPPEKPKLDQLAKLLAKPPVEEPPKSTAKPYDAKAIARLIGETKPAPPSTSQVNPGLPSAHAARMSGSQERQLDDWFKDAYMACWSPPPTIPEGDVYIPQVQVTFNADGSLSGQPVLVNPPPDPVWRAHAESAVRAARRCNPMKVPSQYAPFFEQWRTKTIHFDPREALG